MTLVEQLRECNVFFPGTGSICEEDLEQLKKWDLLMKDEGEAWELTSSGKEELEFIGSVFGGVFPHLKQANRTNFVVRDRYKQRSNICYHM